MLDRIRVYRAGGGLLSLVLLLLALSTVFIFAGDRGYFYRPGYHNSTSAKHLAVAVNLSPQHNFTRFHPWTLDADGRPGYTVGTIYGRYPIGGYALVKLATLPFSGGLSTQLYAARIFYLLAFAASAFLAYLSLCRLASNRWVALTATLLAFSSWYLLYYNDATIVELSIDFFGVMLTFHGMVIFMQDGRFRQLLVKTCIALLLGWHVFALLLPFIILGMGSDLIRVRSSVSSLPIRSRLMRVSGVLVRGRYFLLGVVSLFFGLCVLGSIFASEYYALDGDKSLTELSVFNSLLRRTGIDEIINSRHGGPTAWRPYIERQFRHIFRMSLPYVFLDIIRLEGVDPLWGVERQRYPGWERFWGTFFGVAAYAGCIVGIAFVRHKILFATLSSFGIFWALPMRHTVAHHEFESWYYIGIPLVLFSLILMYVHRRAGSMRFRNGPYTWFRTGRKEVQLCSRRIRRELSIPVVAVLSIAALSIFAVSSFQMAKINHDLEMATFHEAMVRDFDIIRKVTKDKVVFVNKTDRFGEFTRVSQGVDYYLSGSVLLFDHSSRMYALRNVSDYLLTEYRVDMEALLTPENRMVFLYDRRIYYTEIERMIMESRGPVIRSNFDVYLDGRTLIYTKDSCDERDVSTRFFLRVYPVDEGDLPSDHGASPYFDFNEHGTRIEDRCFAVRQLPSYDIAMIRTGQFNFNGPIWQGVFDGEGRSIDRMIAESSDLIIRSDFNVYLDGRTLIYAKDSCDERDVSTRFFLHVYHTDGGDLSTYPRHYEWDNLDFYFNAYGWKKGDACFVALRLPLYDISVIRTGQFGSTGRIWEGTFDLELRDSIDRVIAESIDPVVRSNFDVYLDGATLIYVKESCDERDVSTRFFLHVYPVDVSDISSDPRDSLDFNFNDHGVQTEDGCFVGRSLPPYDIAMIRTGQFDSSSRIWQVVFDTQQRTLDKMIAGAGDPLIRSNFDVYLSANTLIYVKESCGEPDVSTRFFLHVYPVDVSDLPSARRQHGVDNLDFDFGPYGWKRDGGCFAWRPLPPYDIARIVTGQFDSNGRIWQGAFDVEVRE